MTSDERDAVTWAAAECIRMALVVDDLVGARKAERRELVRRLDSRLRDVCERLNKVRAADSERKAAEQKEAGR